MIRPGKKQAVLFMRPKSLLKCIWHDCSHHAPPGMNRESVSTYTTNQAQMEDCIDIRQGTNDNTIAIKTATTDNNRSRSHNANSKI